MQTYTFLKNAFDNIKQLKEDRRYFCTTKHPLINNKINTACAQCSARFNSKSFYLLL